MISLSLAHLDRVCVPGRLSLIPSCSNLTPSSSLIENHSRNIGEYFVLLMGLECRC